MTNPPKLPDGDASPSALADESPTTVIWSGSEQFEILDDAPNLNSSRYLLCEEIQKGGMGTVFRPRDTHLSRDVAIKVLRLDRVDSNQARVAYANEARITSYLSHPGVAPVYDCGTTKDDRPFYVMKFVDGTTLQDLLKREDSTAAHLLSIFADICQTMAFAHSRGVLHVDLKPANVMVGSYGEVYVMDWGLARFEGTPPADCGEWVHGSGEAVEAFGIAGTLDYMSPEQARGETLDARADVFALGALLCEILIGQTPYSGKNVRQVHRRALRASMGEALESLEVCDTDRALVRLTKRCLAPLRRDRPRNAVEVASEVAAYQETALECAESHMNRFFELSLDLFCIADFDGYFRRINSNFSKLLGYSERELLARPFMEFIHPDDINQTLARMAVLNEGQPVVRFNNRYRTQEGRYVTLEWTAQALPDDKVIYAVARDITQP